MSKYSGQDTYNLLCEAREALGASVERWGKFGIDLAKHERNYRIACTKEIFRLHEDPDLRVAWTAAVEMAKGEESAVAELRFLRDCAKVKYSAEQERINFLKIEVRILENETKAIQYGQ